MLKRPVSAASRRCAAGCLVIGLLASSTAALALAARGWVKYEDPRERAFSFDVPGGWAARGGLFRVGYADFRPMVDLRSGDGQANVRFGDVAVPAAYALPTPQHPTDGESDDLGAQAQLVYATYRDGGHYARLYAFTSVQGTLPHIDAASERLDSTDAQRDEEGSDFARQRYIPLRLGRPAANSLRRRDGGAGAPSTMARGFIDELYCAARSR